MTNQIPPSLERFGAELDKAAHRQLATAESRPRWNRPRVFAGGTLGVAGIAAAATLALSGGAAAPAFAISTAGNGTVQVTIDQEMSLPQVNAKLASMGAPQISIVVRPGAAGASGAVACTGGSGTQVDVTLGKDGTEWIPAGNTGAGTWHLESCSEGAPDTGNSGSAITPSGSPSGAIVAVPNG